MCISQKISKLHPGDVIDAVVTHMENFGAFVDIGCGIISFLPIDTISVSRIIHPSERFKNGMKIGYISLIFAIGTIEEYFRVDGNYLKERDWEYYVIFCQSKCRFK